MKRFWLYVFGMLLGLAFLLASISWGAQSALHEREEAERGETNSREVLLEAVLALSALQDAETGQRGYVLTADARYLEPYNAALVREGKIINRLAMLTLDNAPQQVRVAELNKVAAAKLAELAETVALARAGNQSEALAIIRTDRDRELMDKARAILAAISAAESELLDNRHALAVSAAERNHRLTLAFNAVGIVTLLGAGLATILALRTGGRIHSLEALTRRLRLLVEEAPAAIAMFDSEMRYLEVSQQFVTDYGLRDETPQSLRGRSHYRLFPKLPERWMALHRRVLAGETLSAEDDTYTRADGRTDWVNWRMIPWYHEDGLPGGALLFAEIITDRKNKELTLARSEAQLLGLLDALPANIALLDPEGRIVMVNEAWRRFGRDEGLSSDDADMVGADYLAACMPAAAAGDAAALDVLEGLRKILAGRQHRLQLVYPCHSPHGPERWFHFVAVSVNSKTGAPVNGAVVMHLDITQRVLAEQALAHSEARLRGLLDTVIEGIILATEDGHIVSANPAAVRIFGYDNEEQMAGQPLTILMPKREASRHDSYLARHRTTGESRTIDIPGRQLVGVHTDGTEFPLELAVSSFHSGNMRYLSGVLRDITERQKSEAVERHAERLELLVKQRTRELEETQAQLIQAAKVEVLGTLTGGLAHDFNNLLGVIVLNLDVAQRFLADTERAKKLVVDALASARSGAALIRSLLAFARRQPLQPARLALDELVSSVRDLLARTLGEEIEIVYEHAPDLWPVIADASQVETSLLNLATNARDAMPKGGRLTITTRNQRLDADYAKLNPPVAPGDYAMIAVSDIGGGMPPEVLARIFEPFFTTKEPGKGTGLGLSMVFGFAAQSGGHVSVYSEPGVGTTFRLFLPRATDDAGAEASPVVSPTIPERGRGEVILVVEDNVAMREAVVRQLRSLDYHPLEASSALAAVEVLETEKVALVFSDVVMPGGMDGFELAERVAMRWPSVGVLLTSGFLGNHGSRQSDESKLKPGLLGKPYDLNELARAVRKTLTVMNVDRDQA
jgi:PAS domain S-box-containing protein